MKRVLLALAVFLPLVIVPTVAHADGEVSVRAEFYKPKLKTDGTYKWVLFNKCNQPGHPTVAVSGMASYRMVAFATSNFNSANPRLLTTDGNPNEWYQFYFPHLAPGVETMFADVVQDFRPRGFENLSINVPADPLPSASDGCTVTYDGANLPPNENLISHRTTPTVMATDLRVEVTDYATGEAVPCGSTNMPGRIRATLFASAPETADIDYHSHFETGMGGLAGSTGPDQDGNPQDRRNWETSMEDTWTPWPGSGVRVPLQVGEFVSPTSGTRSVVHFAQQTPPGTPKNEVFCAFGPGV